MTYSTTIPTSTVHIFKCFVVETFSPEFLLKAKEVRNAAAVTFTWDDLTEMEECVLNRIAEDFA